MNMYCDIFTVLVLLLWSQQNDIMAAPNVDLIGPIQSGDLVAFNNAIANGADVNQCLVCKSICILI